MNPSTVNLEAEHDNQNSEYYDLMDNDPFDYNQMETGSISDQEHLTENVGRTLDENDERFLHQYSAGLYSQALVDKLAKRTAEFAMNLKGKSKVADKTANFLALNWCQHILFVIDEICGLSEQTHDAMKEVIKAASSTDKQRRLVRLPITYTHIQPPNDARPYIYISILDTLRELFKQPKIAELIHQDYLSKFIIIFHIHSFHYLIST